MNKKALRAMRIYYNKKYKQRTRTRTKAVLQRRLERRPKVTRISERQIIDEELGFDRLQPINDFAGMPSYFLRVK